MKKVFLLLGFLFFVALNVSSQTKIFSHEYKYVNEDSCPIKIIDAWGNSFTDDYKEGHLFKIAHEVMNISGKKVVSWEAKALVFDKFKNHIWTLQLKNSDSLDPDNDDIARSEFPNCGGWQCDFIDSAVVFITSIVMEDRSSWNCDYNYINDVIINELKYNIRKQNMFTYIEVNRGEHKKALKIEETIHKDDLDILPKAYKTFQLMMTPEEIREEISKAYPETMQTVYIPEINSLNWEIGLYLFNDTTIRDFLNQLEVETSKLHINSIKFYSRPYSDLVKDYNFSRLKLVETRNLHGLTNIIEVNFFTQASIDGIKRGLIKQYGKPISELDIRQKEPTSPVEMLFNDGKTAIVAAIVQASSVDYFALEKTSGFKKIVSFLTSKNARDYIQLTKDKLYWKEYTVPFKVNKVILSLNELAKKEDKSSEEVTIEF